MLLQDCFPTFTPYIALKVWFLSHFSTITRDSAVIDLTIARSYQAISYLSRSVDEQDFLWFIFKKFLYTMSKFTIQHITSLYFTTRVSVSVYSNKQSGLFLLKDGVNRDFFCFFYSLYRLIVIPNIKTLYPAKSPFFDGFGWSA